MRREEKKEKMAKIIYEYFDKVVKSSSVEGWRFNGKHLAENHKHKNDMHKTLIKISCISVLQNQE